jgi:ABC-type branched-subunit amino acid transport system ATPase component
MASSEALREKPVEEEAPQLLAIDTVTKRFGGLVAVKEVTLRLGAGTTLGLIGPNGSGKTTLLNVINGVYKPDHGSITLAGRRVEGWRPHRLAELGLLRTFQTARVFSTVTVLGNMLVPLTHQGVARSTAEDRALELLDLVGLADMKEEAASELSGGQHKLLEFARALMPEPRLVLMDEPFAGVHPKIKQTMFEAINHARREGTAFIVVSHEIPELIGLSNRLICMNNGQAICEGRPDEVTSDPTVVEAYLGHPSEHPGGGA